MQLAGSFSFEQWNETAEVLEIERVVATGRVVAAVPYDRAVETLLVRRRRNARELTQTPVPWNIALKLSSSSSSSSLNLSNQQNNATQGTQRVDRSHKAM